MSMDIFGMMAELAADGYAAELQVCKTLDGGVHWFSRIYALETAMVAPRWIGRTPEEAWRKACDAWDREPQKERYKQKPLEPSQPTKEELSHLSSKDLDFGEMPEPGSIHYLSSGDKVLSERELRDLQRHVETQEPRIEPVPPRPGVHDGGTLTILPPT